MVGAHRGAQAAQARAKRHELGAAASVRTEQLMSQMLWKASRASEARATLADQSRAAREAASEGWRRTHEHHKHAREEERAAALAKAEQKARVRAARRDAASERRERAKVATATAGASTATALHSACALGELGSVRALLEGGASPTAGTNTRGHTPIELACMGGHEAVVGELVRASGTRQALTESPRLAARCHRLAARMGHERIAAMFSDVLSPTPHEKRGTPRGSATFGSRVFRGATAATTWAQKGLLLGRMPDGFYEAGCSSCRALRSLEEYRRQAPSRRREVIVVDQRAGRDPKLAAFVQLAAQTLRRLPPAVAHRVAALQGLVCERLGRGDGSGAVPPERASAHLWSLQRKRGVSAHCQSVRRRLREVGADWVTDSPADSLTH
jgi:hypothetical protein